jgi:hypothetical protein
MNRILCCVLAMVVGASVAWADPPAPEGEKASDRLVIHEWGTFTSISGATGAALEWRPLGGEDDLPSFVHSKASQTSGQGLRFGEVCKSCDHPSCSCGTTCQQTKKGSCHCKGCVRSTVRMETPVIYFYSDRERKVRVKVGFPQGQITEWYPQARSINEGIDWGAVLLMPGAKVDLPKESGPSHYYPAREVDAVPVRVCGWNRETSPETERFLFYRGVGTFPLPLAARYRDGDDLELANFGERDLETIVVFERRGSRIGVRIVKGKCSKSLAPRDTRRIDLPLTDKAFTFSIAEGTAKIRAVLETLLVAEGLYAKEARAMVNTWADHWFEEGLRAFYLVPRERTDELLPLTLDPQPDELVRVLVGRLEMITPALRERVRALALGLVSDDRARRRAAAKQFAREGRFAEPVLIEIAEELTPRQRARLAPYLPKPTPAKKRRTAAAPAKKQAAAASTERASAKAATGTCCKE